MLWGCEMKLKGASFAYLIFNILISMSFCCFVHYLRLRFFSPIANKHYRTRVITTDEYPHDNRRLTDDGFVRFSVDFGFWLLLKKLKLRWDSIFAERISALLTYQELLQSIVFFQLIKPFQYIYAHFASSRNLYSKSCVTSFLSASSPTVRYKAWYAVDLSLLPLHAWFYFIFFWCYPFQVERTPLILPLAEQ